MRPSRLGSKRGMAWWGADRAIDAVRDRFGWRPSATGQSHWVSLDLFPMISGSSRKEICDHCWFGAQLHGHSSFSRIGAVESVWTRKVLVSAQAQLTQPTKAEWLNTLCNAVTAVSFAGWNSPVAKRVKLTIKTSAVAIDLWLQMLERAHANEWSTCEKPEPPNPAREAQIKQAFLDAGWTEQQIAARAEIDRQRLLEVPTTSVGVAKQTEFGLERLRGALARGLASFAAENIHLPWSRKRDRSSPWSMCRSPIRPSSPLARISPDIAASSPAPMSGPALVPKRHRPCL